MDNKEYVERPQWQSYEDLSKNQRTKVWDLVKGHVMRQVPLQCGVFESFEYNAACE